MKFAAVVSLFDWAWFYGTWGEAGVHLVLDRLRWAGVKRVYLRVRQCQCYYPSRVDLPGIHFWSEDNCVAEGAWGTKGYEWQWWGESFNFRNFDAPAAFIKRARQLGLEPYAWLEHAEAHGHGWESGFSHDHPELLTVNREGDRMNGNLSWVYPVATDFRLAILREIFEYGFDGVALDFQKGGDHRTARIDQDGVWYAGYEPQAVRAFRERFDKDPLSLPNSDPQWVQFRADYVTEYIRRARAMQQRYYPQQDFGVMGVPAGKPVPFPAGRYGRTDRAENPHGAGKNIDPSWSRRQMTMIPLDGPLTGNLEDHATWTGEGLIDFLCVTPLAKQTAQATPEQYAEVIRGAQSHFRRPVDLRMWQVVWGAGPERVRQIVQGAVNIAAPLGVQETVFFQDLAFEDARWSKSEVTWNALKEALAEVQ